MNGNIGRDAIEAAPAARLFCRDSPHSPLPPSDRMCMDYADVFRPILSLAAHSLPDDPGGDGDAPSRPDPVGDLERLLRHALERRRAGNAGAFDTAWLAVAAWLHERAGIVLRPSPGHFRTETAGRDFFTTLAGLLRAEKADPGDPERLAVVEVYASCLDLGFAGALAAEPERLETCRRRCRGALARITNDDPLSGPPPVAGVRDRAGSLFWIAAWLTPPAVLCGLYCLYSFLLADAAGGRG